MYLQLNCIDPGLHTNDSPDPLLSGSGLIDDLCTTFKPSALSVFI